MSPSPMVIPQLQACAWFEQDPPLAPGSGNFLDVAAGKADVASVEPMQRRRLSPLARGFCHVAQRLSPRGDVPVVFASQHGEADRTLAILKDLAAEREVSPALFSMSVHNAVPGLWSILQGNRASATALAAGPETFGWGLVEALGILQAEPTTPVLYVYADDRLPEPWAAGRAQPGLFSVGLLLGGSQGRTLALAREPGSEGQAGEALAHHFLAAWRGGPGVWEGAGGRWRWQFE